MGYSADSFTAGEQPTTAKWNKLWANDASFNDGTGIANLRVGSVTALKNDYKFRGYRNAAQNTSGGVYTTVLCDTEVFDTSNNFDISSNKGRFTSPINGFFQFNGAAGIAASSGTTGVGVALYKNGSVAAYGPLVTTSTGGSFYNCVSDELQVSTNDYVELYVYCNGTVAIDVGSSAKAYFSGFMVSNT